jgi:hypothetical protein
MLQVRPDHEDDNPPTPTEFLNWLRHWWDAPREKSKAADWVMVGLTVAVAIAAFWSACIFQAQLTEMHQASIMDQRAWVGLAHVDELQPFDGALEHYPKFSLRFVNSGKTPATNVATRVDWQPSETFVPLCTGAIPQSFEAQSIPPQGEFILRDPTENPSYIEDSTHQYWPKVHGAGAYFCVYGEVSYTDVFLGRLDAIQHIFAFTLIPLSRRDFGTVHNSTIWTRTGGPFKPFFGLSGGNSTGGQSLRSFASSRCPSN